ncbi:MAG: hypothetical protein AAFZ63_12185 [Bacteroidota bacterium]
MRNSLSFALLLLSIFSLLNSGRSQSFAPHEIAQFDGWEHLEATRYVNQFIDSIIEGEYDPKFFGYRGAMTKERYDELIPNWIYELQARNRYRTNLTYASNVLFGKDRAAEVLTRNILVTTRRHKQTGKPVLVAIKISFGYFQGISIDNFTFLEETSEEYLALSNRLGCPLLYYLVGEGPNNGCQHSLGSSPSPPPPPPSGRTLPTDEEEANRRLAKTSFTVKTTLDLEKIGQYPRLRTLEIDCKYCLEFPLVIMELKQLERLTLKSPAIYNIPSDFSALEQLSYLHIESGWPVPELTGINSLNHLSFDFDHWTEFPTYITDLPNLDTLTAHNLHGQTFETLENSPIENLTVLRVIKSHLPPLQFFPGLKALEFSGKVWRSYNYDYQATPLSLTSLTYLLRADTLPHWVFKIPNLNELQLNCWSIKAFPQYIETLELERLVLNRECRRKISPELIARLRQKEGLVIEWLD